MRMFSVSKEIERVAIAMVGGRSLDVKIKKIGASERSDRKGTKKMMKKKKNLPECGDVDSSCV